MVPEAFLLLVLQGKRGSQLLQVLRVSLGQKVVAAYILGLLTMGKDEIRPGASSEKEAKLLRKGRGGTFENKLELGNIQQHCLWRARKTFKGMLHSCLAEEAATGCRTHQTVEENIVFAVHGSPSAGRERVPPIEHISIKYDIPSNNCPRHRSFTSLCSQRQIYEQEERKKGFRFKLLSLKTKQKAPPSGLMAAVIEKGIDDGSRSRPQPHRPPSSPHPPLQSSQLQGNRKGSHGPVAEHRLTKMKKVRRNKETLEHLLPSKCGAGSPQDEFYGFRNNQG
ncbi:hypothetical protein ACRRTK_011065 [Alexandromys fortis]